VDASGVVYSSGSHDVASVNRYTVDWDALENSAFLPTTPISPIPLWDETNPSLELDRLQAGVLSPTGRLLYLVAGYCDTNLPTDGIHVFDLPSGRRVRRSTNGHGYFNYEFHPVEYDEEPEGLTIWDLDGSNLPGISGQLHVLMLDNDNETLGDDDVYLKHYTHTITVDRSYVGPEEGTPQKPFNTVTEAHTLAWDGANIAIRTGSYPETLVLTKAV